MLPKKFAPVLFGFLVSGLMSFVVTAVATYRTIGFVSYFISPWMNAWMPAWAIAFVMILIVSPMVRRFVEVVTKN